MTDQISPEQRKKIEQGYRRGREAIIIFICLSVLILSLFFLTLIFV